MWGFRRSQKTSTKLPIKACSSMHCPREGHHYENGRRDPEYSTPGELWDLPRLSSLFNPTSSTCWLTAVPVTTGTQGTSSLTSCLPPASSAGLAQKCSKGYLPPEVGTWVLQWEHLCSPAGLLPPSYQFLLRNDSSHKPGKELSQVTAGYNTHTAWHLCPGSS